MNPQEQLDQNVVNLAKAIRSVETQGQKDPYTARGASGEFGAYQYTPATWEKASQKFLGRVVPLEQATKEIQNEVTYKQIKEFKDAGYNIGQIASMWNSGKPDAYLDPKYTGVNKYGVKYDVPQYAKSVAAAYQSIKGSGDPTVTPVTASTVGHEQRGTPDTQAQAQEDEPKKDFLQKAEGLISKIFPGQKIGQAIGTLGGYAAAKAKDAATGGNTAEFYDTSAPTPLQVTGDAAAAALMVGAGMPGKAVSAFGANVPLMKTAATAGGRIAQAAGIGGGFGLTNALSEGKTDAGEIAKDSLIGMALGGALGTGSEAIQKVAASLPKWLARKFITTPASNETIEYAVKKGLGAPKTMLRESEASIKALGSQLDDVLKNPKYANVKIKGNDILDDVIAQFPDSGLTKDQLVANLKKIAPLKAASIDKLLRGEFTLKELHTLNSALGKNTFKTAFDDPAVKAGKDLGSAVYHNISNRLKTAAPESVQLFDDLSMEYPLRTALERLIKRNAKAKAFSLFEVAALLGGHVFGGPVGSVAALAGEKALRSPTVNLKAAGLVSGLAGPQAQALRQGLKAPVLNTSTGLMQELMADRASQ